jgi:hypothetical protein
MPRSKHGHAIAPNKRSKTYESWQMMKYRCHTPSSHDYPNYGGLGISVCSRWRESFSSFLDDMGTRPEGMTLDRIDVRGDYELSNCRWADRKTQANNRKPPKQRHSKLGYRGVVEYTPGKFGFRLYAPGRSVYGFKNPEDAATAYNFAAAELHGEFARYNTVTQPWLDETT